MNDCYYSWVSRVGKTATTAFTVYPANIHENICLIQQSFDTLKSPDFIRTLGSTFTVKYSKYKNIYQINVRIHLPFAKFKHSPCYFPYISLVYSVAGHRSKLSKLADRVGSLFGYIDNNTTRNNNVNKNNNRMRYFFIY